MNVNDAPTRTIYPGLIMLALVFMSFLDSGAGAAELDRTVAGSHSEYTEQMHYAARRVVATTTDEMKEMLSETTRPKISLRLVEATEPRKSRL